LIRFKVGLFGQVSLLKPFTLQAPTLNALAASMAK
jgi:hypothetical protein